MWGDNFTRKAGYWWDVSKFWQFIRYGFIPNGLFDLIYNTMRKIIDEMDQTDWGKKAIENCVGLLMWKIRYPYNYKPETMAKNRVVLLGSKVLYALKLVPIQKYGPITMLTRDPFTYVLAACVILGERYYIYHIRIPWYLHRPTFSAWVWYLRSGKGKRLYETLQLIEGIPRKEYKRNLVKYRAMAAKSERILKRMK